MERVHIREGAACYEDVWERLEIEGFTIVSDTNPEFGFDPDFRRHLLGNYFNAGLLEAERYDVFPPDRERARELLAFASTDSDLLLVEHQTATIETRTYFAGKRDYRRTPVLQDPKFEHWIRSTFLLLPEDQEPDKGTFGVNIFRTRTEVVSGPHQDGELFVVVYVVDKHGAGGASQLFTHDSDKPFFERTLKPGQLLIFNDQRFRHSVTPLEPAADGRAQRDVLVCTIDKLPAQAF